MSIFTNNGVNNYGGVPLIGANTLANRPLASIRGRLFVDTTNNLLQYDTGTAWVTIGSSGPSGAGAAGQATFWTGASTISGDNAFFWDNTNKRLGLGTTTPGVRLDIHGTGVIQQLNGTTTNDAFLDFQNAGTSRWRVGNNYNGGTPLFSIQNRTSNLYPFQLYNDGSVMFGSTDFNKISGLPEYYTFVREGGTCVFNVVSANTINTAVTVYFSKTRGATKNNFAATQNGDDLFNMAINGTNGTSWAPSSQISVVQTGTSTAAAAPGDILFYPCNSSGISLQLRLAQSGFSTFTSRLNVANATDNANFELNVNGNTYTGGLSPTILTVSGNTTMARTVTGYRCTGTLTLTLPAVSGLNQWYIVINDSAGTVTINRNGTDTITNTAGTSVTSLTLAANARTFLYLGGGTITYQIF